MSKSTWVNAAALTRLSDAVGPFLTKYSSTRDISVKGESGDERLYDLFKAERFGKLEENPFLKPGDIITVRRLNCSVSVSGEVRRPGTYQLLPGEGMKELVEAYGDGFTNFAKPVFSTLLRRSSASNPDAAVLRFDYSAAASRPALLDGDTVSIASTEDYLPVIYYEGAISPGAEPAKQYSTSREIYRMGDLLSRSLKSVANRISPNADLKRAFIARKGQADVLSVNLEKLLFDYDPKEDVSLLPEDRIVIPFGSLDVFVSGEVTKSTWVNAAALTRLSDAVGPLLTRYSSIRDIAVKGEGGDEKLYDLFKAERLGELEQNPFLRPGDVVTVHRLSRSVSISGEVRRPGSYQLLPGEGLKELVDYYGGGLFPTAKPDLTTLVRRSTNETPSGEVHRFNFSDPSSPLPELMDGDSVAIPSTESFLPVVYFEGAISAGTEAAKQYGVDRQVYREGDLLSRALRSVADRISPMPTCGGPSSFERAKGIPSPLIWKSSSTPTISRMMLFSGPRIESLSPPVP